MAEKLPGMDEDAVAMLKQATKGKPRRFVMITNGNKLLRLVVF